MWRDIALQCPALQTSEGVLEMGVRPLSRRLEAVRARAEFASRVASNFRECV